MSLTRKAAAAAAAAAVSKAAAQPDPSVPLVSETDDVDDDRVLEEMEASLPPETDTIENIQTDHRQAIEK